MAVAYVVEQNAAVSCEGERLVVKKGGTLLHALHLFKLDQLVLFGNVLLTPLAMARLLRDEIDTVFMTRSGRYRGRLQPPHSKNITLRCEQFSRMGREDFCLKTARAIVAGKLGNLRTVLQRLNRSRDGLALEDHILNVKRLAEKTATAADLDTLRGLEGRGAVLYFEGFARGFIAEGVEFRKRVRRPPTDPVNALLSLGYTLLFNTVLAAVSMVGFDPYLGCLHAVEYGRPSLALDLMEEWRPVIVDTLVLSVFNLKTLTPADFTRGAGAAEELADDEAGDPVEESGAGGEGPEPSAAAPLPVRLTDAGFRKFITQFERKMNQEVSYPLTGQQFSYRDCIREQVRHFARYVRGEEDVYQPFVFK
jgi:CRISPR-associated protein Cas1